MTMFHCFPITGLIFCVESSYHRNEAMLQPNLVWQWFSIENFVFLVLEKKFVSNCLEKKFVSNLFQIFLMVVLVIKFAVWTPYHFFINEKFSENMSKKILQ